MSITAAEVADVRAQVVVRGRVGAGALERDALDALDRAWPASAFACSPIQPVTSVSAGPPLGGLYLKPPSSGGLCDGRHHDPVGEAVAPAPVVGQDRVRDDRRRRVPVGGVDADVDAVRAQHLERAP